MLNTFTARAGTLSVLRATVTICISRRSIGPILVSGLILTLFSPLENTLGAPLTATTATQNTLYCKFVVNGPMSQANPSKTQKPHTKTGCNGLKPFTPKRIEPFDAEFKTPPLGLVRWLGVRRGAAGDRVKIMR